MSKRASSPLLPFKNSLRPFFNDKKSLRYDAHLQRIRVSATPRLLPQILELVEDKPHYRFPGLGSTFPKDPKYIPDFRTRNFQPLPLAREFSLQVARINHHAEKLEAALRSTSQINRQMLAGSWDESEYYINNHESEFGHSLTIAKKALVVSLQLYGFSGFSKKYKALIKGHDNSAWGFTCRYIYDMLDPAFDPAKASRNWLAACARRGGGARWYGDIIEPLTLGFAPSSSDLAGYTMRAASLSLLDLLFSIWRAFVAVDASQEVQQAVGEIDPRIRSLLEEEFRTAEISIPSQYILPGLPATDLELFRASFIYNEFASVSEWRADLGRSAFSTSVEEQEAEQPLALRRMRQFTRNTGQAGLYEYDRSALNSWCKSLLGATPMAGGEQFLASLIGAEYIRTSTTGPISPDVMIDVIARHEDIHENLSRAELEDLQRQPTVQDNPLLEFLISETIYRKDRNLDKELERRASFMTMFASTGRSGIIPFLDSTKEKNLAAARRVARICTRGFLERLYLLMGSVKDVLETRLAVCQWLSANGEDETEANREESQALERELANLDARSDLDSTRIHVDEDALREWFEQVQAPLIKRYVQTVISEGLTSEYQSFLTFYNKLKEADESDENFLSDTQIGSEFVLLQIVERTLDAFKSNPTFGLAAYLSRRVRHGSLSGRILTPINRSIRKFTEGSDDVVRADIDAGRIGSDSDRAVVKAALDRWVAQLVSSIDHARRNIIQIRSPETPNGLIVAEWRTTGNVTYLDAMISQVRQRTFESKGEYDFFPDVYSLCWDILESDLANLRRFVTQDFQRNNSSDLKAIYQDLPFDQRVVARAIFQEVDASLAARAQEICGWFIRPVFRRDKYNLKTLINSTLSITRELDDKYEFSEKVEVEDTITVNRGGFEVIGDILFVLIGNAARHGRRGGCVMVSARSSESLPGNLTLEVSSTVDTDDQFNASRARISDFATAAENELDAAAVGEGFSGIKKIVSILRGIRGGVTEFEVTPSPTQRQFTFRVSIPAEITLGQRAG